MAAMESPMNSPQDIADRYAAVWNESDPDLRRKGIAELWDPDGAHYVRTLEARGFDALEKRITGAYEKNVRGAGHRFRAAPNAQTLRNVVTFNWEMVPADRSKVLAVGLEFLSRDSRATQRIEVPDHVGDSCFGCPSVGQPAESCLVLDDRGRIVADYQFMVA
jgi:hypothetical protein